MRRLTMTLAAVLLLAVGMTGTAVADDPGITAPAPGATLLLTQDLELAAVDAAAAGGGVQWAVRYETCAANTNTRAGNVDGFDSDYGWSEGAFSASIDVSTWAAGEYCFVFNPADGGRYTRTFDLATEAIPVNEDNLEDDWFASTVADATVAFVTDSDSPLGGALQLTTADTNDSKAKLGSDQDAGMALSDVNNVGYATFVSDASAGSALHAPAINIAILADGTEGSFTTLVFEPIYTHGNDAIVRGTWQTWDASGAAKWWSTRDIDGVCASSCYVTFDDIKAANPDAVVVSYAMNLGSWNPNIQSRVDAFTIGAKTFDFEPKVHAHSACKDGGWETMTDADGNEFTNQGDCVSYFASDGKTRGPKK